VCKGEILSNSLEFEFLGVFLLFFLLCSELCFIISKSNFIRWLHGNECECRVEKKQESRAGEEMIGVAREILRGCSRVAQEVT